MSLISDLTMILNIKLKLQCEKVKECKFSRKLAMINERKQAQIRSTQLHLLCIPNDRGKNLRIAQVTHDLQSTRPQDPKPAVPHGDGKDAETAAVSQSLAPKLKTITVCVAAERKPKSGLDAPKLMMRKRYRT